MLLRKKLRPHSKITFEMRVKDSLIERDYELWLVDESESAILLMKARKFIKITKTTFDIMNYWREKD